MKEYIRSTCDICGSSKDVYTYSYGEVGIFTRKYEIEICEECYKKFRSKKGGAK